MTGVWKRLEWRFHFKYSYAAEEGWEKDAGEGWGRA